MAFVNTRDVIGDQATVDGLVEHSLTELKEDGIGAIESFACYKNTGLQAIELPSVSKIGTFAFEDCDHLETVRLGGYGSSGKIDIGDGAFRRCLKLKNLFIDRSIMANVYAGSSFTNTLLARGDGAVYVPKNLIETYRTNYKWKWYIIADIDEYPLSIDESIHDSWSEILTNQNYSTEYPVRSYKTLELTDGTKIRMDIVALDTDVKADDSGTAKITWLCHTAPFTAGIDDEAVTGNGWRDSTLRSWLVSDILPKIPQEIRSHIVSVKKSYRTNMSTAKTLWCEDDIWIPSGRELCQDSYAETEGVRYSNFFINDSSYQDMLIRQNPSGSEATWWTRSVDGTYYYRCIALGGHYGSNSISSSGGVVFGFCTD